MWTTTGTSRTPRRSPRPARPGSAIPGGQVGGAGMARYRFGVAGGSVRMFVVLNKTDYLAGDELAETLDFVTQVVG